MENLGISTDVDRLVLALRAAPGRNFSIAELAKTTGMAERAVRKWVHALEADGKVAVRYSLTKELVSWTAASDAMENYGEKQEEENEQAINAAPDMAVSAYDAPSPTISDNGANDIEGDIKTARELEDKARRKREYEGLLAEKRMLLSQLIMLEAENEKMKQRKQERRMEDSEEEITRIVESVRKMEEASEMRENASKQENEMEPMTADGARIVPVDRLEVPDLQKQADEEKPPWEKEGEGNQGEGKKTVDSPSDDDSGDGGDGGPGVDKNEDREKSAPSLGELLENEEAEEKGGAGNEERNGDVEIIPSAGAGETYTGERGIGGAQYLQTAGETGSAAKAGESMPAQMQEEAQTIGKASFSPRFAERKKMQKDGRLEEFSGKLAAHMARIQAKARDIEKIKAEKKRLLHEVYAPLSAKAQEELEAITDRILDYENRLLSLREHVAGLPGQVADASDRHEKMAALAKEMQKLYDETEAMSEESLRALLEAKENAAMKADEVRTMQFEQENMLSSLRSELSRVSALQADAEGRLSDVNNALARQMEGVEKAQGELEKIAGVRAQIEGEMENINAEVGRQTRILSDLDLHLERMGTVGSYVMENRRDYQRKMNALAEYVAKGENEYAAIRESVEANFVRKYLRELRAVSESYEFELSSAKQAEAHYERDIEKAKAELEGLIEEAKKIAQMQEMQLDESAYEPAHGKEERLLAAVSSNSKQRERLRSYIREAISGGKKEKPKHKQTAAKSFKAGKKRRK